MSEGKHFSVNLEVSHPPRPSRLLALATLLMIVKPILLIPHFIVIYILGFCSFVAGAVSQAVVLFTGKYPRGLFLLIKVTLQWQLRMNAFMFGLTDEYPPFDLGEDRKEISKALWWMLGIVILLIIIGLLAVSLQGSSVTVNS